MARTIRKGAEVVLTCHGCESEVAFEYADLVQCDVASDYCVCPECKARIHIIIPQSWKQAMAKQEAQH